VFDLDAQQTIGIGREEQVPGRSMEHSLKNGDYRLDYHQAVGSGAVGHSSVIPMIHLNVLLYTAPS
jgi:hypothetical protein